jgi:hypothetical protein
MGLKCNVGYTTMKACKFKITFRYYALTMCMHGVEGNYAHNMKLQIYSCEKGYAFSISLALDYIIFNYHMVAQITTAPLKSNCDAKTHLLMLVLWATLLGCSVTFAIVIVK